MAGLLNLLESLVVVASMWLSASSRRLPFDASEDRTFSRKAFEENIGQLWPAIAFHAGVSSLWISITSCRGSGTSITGRSGAGAAFALALASGFTVGTAAFEGARLGVGDTHLVALVGLVGVAGEGIGVVGALVL